MSINALAIDKLNLQAIGKQTLKVLSKQKAVVAIGIMLIVMIFSPRNFYTALNIMNIFRMATPHLIIAFGVTLVVICRGCDLSVGSVMALSGILAVQMVNSGMNMYLAILLAILSGSLVGFINGFLVVQQKTEAFIITLGMGMLIKGVALLLTNANPIPVTRGELSDNFQAVAEHVFIRLGGIEIPNIVVFMVVILIFTYWLMRYTSFGRNCYALGGDYEVAEHSGINVIRTKWIAFVITGTYAAIAGVLMASRLNSGSPIIGDATPLFVNCAVVIGGTSFAGGVGGPVYSFFGIMVMEILRNGMSMFGINRFAQTLILGIVIVSIIALDCYAIKRKKEDV
jgi:ribose transport system permease protein